MFFSHGKSVYERGEHGDDFAVKNTLLQHVMSDLMATNVLPLFVYTPIKEQQPSLAYIYTCYMLMNKLKMYFMRN